MDRKTVETGRPVRAGAVTVIAVEETFVGCRRLGSGLSFFGGKQPLAVVAVSQESRRAFRMTGEEVSLEEVMQEAPGLRDALERV